MIASIMVSINFRTYFRVMREVRESLLANPLTSWHKFLVVVGYVGHVDELMGHAD